MGNAGYFIQGDDRAEYGPVDLRELQGWALENRVGLNTPVRMEPADSPWRPWQEYPELVALLAQARVQRKGKIPPDLIGLEMAPVWKRVMGWFLDNLLLFLPLFLFLSIYRPETMAHLQALSRGPDTVIDYPEILFISLLLNVMQLAMLTVCLFRCGATPANWLLQIQVVNTQGNAPSLGQSFLRSFFFILSLNLVPYGLPLFYVFFNPCRRALHDLIAGTYVVRGRR